MTNSFCVQTFLQTIIYLPTSLAQNQLPAKEVELLFQERSHNIRINGVVGTYRDYGLQWLFHWCNKSNLEDSGLAILFNICLHGNQVEIVANPIPSWGQFQDYVEYV